MAYRWKILRAAVEQEILFPSRAEFERYIKTLQDKGQFYEISSVVERESGEVEAIMRKQYNGCAVLPNKNLFLARGQEEKEEDE